jgi:hypothetical protein
MSCTELATLPPIATPAFEDREEAPRRQDVEGVQSISSRTCQEIAPVDGGSAAWGLLCAAFVFETLLWGKLIHGSSSTDVADRD